MLYFLQSVAALGDKLPDGGPIYRETNLAAQIVEPWNTATAIIFLLISAYWFIRLKGNYRNYVFLLASMGILVIGGFGGALYHGLRSSHVFLLMDVLPIFGLALAAAVYLWNRLLKKTWQVIVVISCFILSHLGINAVPDLHHDTVVSIEYFNMGLMILLPLLGVMLKTKFRYWGLVAASLCSFLLALAFRVIDAMDLPFFSMGTHWLWHTFGALASFIFSHYIYRIITLRNRALRMRVDF